MSKACRSLPWLLLFAGVTSFFCSAQTQPNPQGPSAAKQQSVPPAHKVPVMDGGAGPCSLGLAVTTPDGRPVYAATIRVHIAYGFAGFRRLDLEASTNVDGRVDFTGLPSRVHRPPLTFRASKDQLAGLATYDPDAECQAKHDIVLELPKPPSAN